MDGMGWLSRLLRLLRAPDGANKHMKKNHMKPQETVVNEDEEELGVSNEVGHGSDIGVGSDEITTGEEVFVKSDNLDKESGPLTF